MPYCWQMLLPCFDEVDIYHHQADVMPVLYGLADVIANFIYTSGRCYCHHDFVADVIAILCLAVADVIAIIDCVADVVAILIYMFLCMVVPYYQGSVKASKEHAKSMGTSAL